MTARRAVLAALAVTLAAVLAVVAAEVMAGLREVGPLLDEMAGDPGSGDP